MSTVKTTVKTRKIDTKKYAQTEYKSEGVNPSGRWVACGYCDGYGTVLAPTVSRAYLDVCPQCHGEQVILV